MILYFDKNGALKEALNYGPAARAGTTNFKIFAYFEDTDPVAFNTASLRLRKPDLDSNMYPSLLMTQETLTFDSSIQESSYFVDGQSYRGFGFDFSTSEYNVILLDTPGLWEGIISLYASHVVAVQGIVTFNVQNGNFITDGTEVDFEDILPSIYGAIAEKLSIIDGIVVVPNILPETVDVTKYNVGQMFYNEADKNYYVLSLVSDTRQLVRYSMGNARFFTTALTGTNTMADLLALTGNDPAFVYIDGSLYLVSPFTTGTYDGYYNFSMLKVASSGEDFSFLDIYKVSNTYRETNLSSILSNTGIYHKKIATEDFVNDELSNYYTKAETYTQTEIDNLLAGKLDYAGVFEYSQSSGNTTVSQLYAQYGDKPFTLTWKGPFNSGTYLCVIPAAPVLIGQIIWLFNVQSGATFLSTSVFSDSTLITIFGRTFTEYTTKDYVDTGLATKQATLVSGTNIKTVNGESILGAGNIQVASGVWGSITGNIADQTDLQNELNGKQDELTAGSNITINNNVISATDTDTTYSAGTGLNLDDTTFSVDTSVIATKSSVDAIEELIPAQATSSNQLADKDFVNSSIATQTAYFLGTFNIVTDLGLTTSATHSEVASAIATELASESVNPTNNDYVFVAYPDATVSTEFTQFDRYKYNSSTTSWEWEYTLNNSSFTAEQWAAINSGITAAKIETFVLKDLIGSEYDGTTSYSVGDLVIYNDKLYRRTDPTTTPDGDFDPTNWAMTDVDTELGNRVTLDTDQTITGAKTFNGTVSFYGSNNEITGYSGNLVIRSGGDLSLRATNAVVKPYANASYDLGSSSFKWKDLYLTGKTDFGNDISINSNSYGGFEVKKGSSVAFTVYGTYALSTNFYPAVNNSYNLGSSTNAWKDIYMTGNLNLGNNVKAYSSYGGEPGTSSFVVNIDNSTVFTIGNDKLIAKQLAPDTNNTWDIGNEMATWRDLYLSGIINPNSNGYGLAIPSTSAWTANKQIATSDQAFNVINASDIINNTLTQEQYNIITNGKPTLIKGAFLSRNNIYTYSQVEQPSQFIGQYIAGIDYGTITINKSTKIISISPATASHISLNSIDIINGKNIPVYPSSPASAQVLTYNTNNTMSWSDFPKELPTTLGTAGQVLKVNANANGVEWGTITVPTYTAGTGISISNGQISVDSSVVAMQSDLPTGDVDVNLNDTTTTPTSTVALNNIFVGTAKYTVTSTSEAAASGGSTLSLVTTGEKYTWNSKMSNPMTTSQDIIVGGSSGTPTRLPKGSNGDILRVNGSGNLAYGKGLPYIDCTGANPTYPSADNTDGLIIVLCASEPATKYEGYIYIVKASSTPSGYEVILNAYSGDGGIVYVQINDDTTWYSATIGPGFYVVDTDIPNAYTVVEGESIGIANVTKIRIGTGGNPASTSGPKYHSEESTGDFVGLTFTSTGVSTPQYATSEITLTQDSTITFEGNE